MGYKYGPPLLIVVLLLIALNAALYDVDENQQAIVIQLGKPVRSAIAPGLHLKIPFIQKVVCFDRRMLDYDAAPAEMLTTEKKSLKIDCYAKWHIADPLTFFRTLRTVEAALLRLDDIIDSEIRTELGRHLMTDIVSTRRAALMRTVLERANTQAQAYGIEVDDIRIKRIHWPQENQMVFYGRMQAEQDRQAKKYRAEGQAEAFELRAAADGERTVILAEAQRKAQTIRGEGDAEAARIYSGAFSQDPEFFNFVRTLEASCNTLDRETVLVMSPDYEFLEFMKKSGANLGP